METKSNYSAPRMEIVPMLSYGNILESLSMGVSDVPIAGGGDAKGSSFFDEEEGGGADFTLWD